MNFESVESFTWFLLKFHQIFKLLSKSRLIRRMEINFAHFDREKPCHHRYLRQDMSFTESLKHLSFNGPAWQILFFQ